MEMMNRHSFIQFVKEFQLYLFFLLYCCDRWGHIVALTQVLMMYQIYHTWIHLHNHSPSSSSPDSWSTFSRYHFRIYLHLYTFYCTIFTLLPPFPNISSFPLVSALPLSRTCSTLLFSDFVREKTEMIEQKPWHFSLR
jgi:hypothetical protein